MQISRHFQSLVRAHDDLPAFHAGYVVLVVLAAFLFNLGFFAALVALSIALDLQQRRASSRFRFARGARLSAREHLPDIGLLLAGLVAAVYLGSIADAASIAGALRTGLELTALLSVAAPKLLLLRRFLRRWMPFHRRFEEPRAALPRRLRATERAILFACVLGAALLTGARVMLPIDTATLVRLYAEQLVPWRI